AGGGAGRGPGPRARRAPRPGAAALGPPRRAGPGLAPVPRGPPRPRDRPALARLLPGPAPGAGARPRRLAATAGPPRAARPPRPRTAPSHGPGPRAPCSNPETFLFPPEARADDRPRRCLVVLLTLAAAWGCFTWADEPRDKKPAEKWHIDRALT